MSKWNESVNAFFNDKELLSNIASGVSLTIALGLGMLYFGFYDSINWSALLNTKTFGLTVVAIISNWVWRIDVEKRAFNDELRINKKLEKIENDLDVESKKVDDIDNAIAFVNNWNRQQQEMFNTIKTDKRVTYLNQLILYNKVRQVRWYNKLPFLKIRSTHDITLEIEELYTNPLIDTSFKPITLTQLISVEKTKISKERKGVETIEYNPQRDGTKKSLIFSLVKFAGIGGGGSMAFLVSTPLKTILIFYAMLILAMLITTIRRYLKVRKNTSTTYFITRKNKLSLIREMNGYVPVKQIETKGEKNEKSN